VRTLQAAGAAISAHRSHLSRRGEPQVAADRVYFNRVPAKAVPSSTSALAARDGSAHGSMSTISRRSASALGRAPYLYDLPVGHDALCLPWADRGHSGGATSLPVEERAGGVEQPFRNFADVGIPDIVQVPATEGRKKMYVRLVCAVPAWFLRSQLSVAPPRRTSGSISFGLAVFGSAGRLWTNANVAEFLRREVI
jgi:hypothetical protein